MTCEISIYLFQTLGFKTTSKEQLDSWMLNAFQKNIPPHFNLLASTEQFNPKSDNMTSKWTKLYL